jgi:PAS domain S-box-containing protein
MLGVLVVTMVVVSALVLWHEARVLEDELVSRADLLAHILAFAASDGGSPEYLAIMSMSDLRAGEVRSSSGQLLWQYGPSIGEIETYDSGLLRVERQIEVGRGAWGKGETVSVVLLLSQSRLRSHLATAAIRLLVGLGIALTLALIAGLALIARVVNPLQGLAHWVRGFDPDDPIDPPRMRGTTAEVGDLALAFRDMAERLAEGRRSLVASERRFRELFTASPSPLLRVGDDLTLREANPAAETYLGRSEQRSVGTPLASYLERPGFDQVLRDVSDLKAGQERVIEAVWRLAGDDLAEVELHVVAAGDDEERGFLVAIHDLTDRVRRMGERWRRTFDTMVDGVALVGSDGKITLANRALQAHTSVVASGLAERLQDETRRAWRAEHVGRLLDCSLAVAEGREHAVLVVRDVTEAVDAEERLRDAEKMRAVGALASGVAHDFNNLLAAIFLHSRLVERQPERGPDAAAAIANLAEQGTEVVRELLLFARRESNPPVTFDLAEMVRRQEGVLRHLLTEGVELNLELDEEPVAVVGDVVGLRRLLLNLVLNARDAVAEGGGSIDLRVERTAGRAVLEVADDGPGIAPEVREHLFEPFFTLRRQGRGSGLGLAVVYGIATAHGGDVDVRSAPGDGARFIVRFPAGDPRAIETLDGAGGSAASRARILLMEPYGRAAAAIVEELAALDHEVRHAPDTDTAAELLAHWSPTVVVVSGGGLDSDAASFLRGLQLPIAVFSEASDEHADWGPGVVTLQPASSPSDLVEALAELGILDTA